jgi:hypothetical protein
MRWAGNVAQAAILELNAKLGNLEQNEDLKDRGSSSGNNIKMNSAKPEAEGGWIEILWLRSRILWWPLIGANYCFV